MPTQWLFALLRGGGTLINMEPLNSFYNCLFREIDLHSGSVYLQSGCLCYEGMEGKTPDNYGTLEVV